jgi:nicotinate dehydrogenase subunit A
VSDAVELTVNGRLLSLAGEGERPLLDALRNDLGLTASRFGCGEGLCGACHVIIDGRAVAACDTPLSSLTGRFVVTLEGLGSEEAPHPLQEAFIAEQAMQCGYCISGVIISAAALLAASPDPTDEEIRQALQRNLCRCGAHNRIIRAIRRAAAMLRQARVHA